MTAKVCTAVMLAALAAAAGLAGEPPAAADSWTRRFPEIAARIPHFEQRMACDSAAVRLRVLTALTYFHFRDSKLYPPFLKALVKDPAPNIRWEAIWKLREHNVFLPARELPDELAVPLAGRFRPRDQDSLAAFRRVVAEAADDDARAGWALCALAVAKDREALAPARKRLGSANVFVRFSAATALLEIGGEPERDEAMAELEKLAAAQDDASGFYRMRAAEVLVRLGRARHLKTLIDAAADREAYADSGTDLLSDLTGVYFPTVAEYRKWYEKQKDRPEAP
jgi:HEAT repeat protein